MKCGKKIREDRVFCDDCLALMAQYPVKPGTTVQLHNRPAVTIPKPVHREITPEEQVLQLRKAVRGLRVALVTALLLLGLSITMLVHDFVQPDEAPAIGRNYSTTSSRRTP